MYLPCRRPRDGRFHRTVGMNRPAWPCASVQSVCQISRAWSATEGGRCIGWDTSGYRNRYGQSRKPLQIFHAFLPTCLRRLAGHWFAGAGMGDGDDSDFCRDNAFLDVVIRAIDADTVLAA